MNSTALFILVHIHLISLSIAAFILLIALMGYVFFRNKRLEKPFAHQSVHPITDVPQLQYSSNHLWLSQRAPKDLYIGIDNFLTRLLGKASFVSCVDSGQTINKGDILGYIMQGSKSFTVLSPLSGKVRKLNDQFHLEGCDSNPIPGNWLLQLHATRLKQESTHFIQQGEMAAWVRSEVIRLRDFLAASLWRNNQSAMAQTLQDGGEIITNLLHEVPEEIWIDFENDFLNFDFPHSPAL